ncbi:MAG TPA: alpha/beta hydrolase-fold protein [Granulicella sp.]
MRREWHKWFSPRLGRDMELLVFGHAGVPTLVFPTSRGRFYEWENRGMVNAVAAQVEHGELMLICVDSIDTESWYNRGVGPRWRIARHMQYESYLLEEVVPLIRALGNHERLAAAGASFGGYHAANLALRNPDLFRAFLAMGAMFDLSVFLDGYYDEDCYFNLPTHYLPNMNDSWHLDRFRQNTYVLATGEYDICRGYMEHMAGMMWSKGIPARLDVWGYGSMHDWPEWEKMVRVYL